MFSQLCVCNYKSQRFLEFCNISKAQTGRVQGKDRRGGEKLMGDTRAEKLKQIQEADRERIVF